MTDIRVRPVRTGQDLERFVRLPHELYAEDPNWVPPLDSDVRETLSAERNPFFQHAERELFLAELGGRPVGRIAAIIDRNYVAHRNQPIGFFGFFETTKVFEVAAALFEAARGWLKERGMHLMRGPANPSLNDEAGMLLEGYDSPPVIKMTYNPPYYLEFCERFGMTKAKDLFAYHIDANQPVPDGFLRAIESLKSMPGLKVRPLNLRHLTEDLMKVREVYNDAWSGNWDFSPFTDAEMVDTARKLRPLIMPDIIPIIEIKGEPVGMAIALPDYNQVLIHMNGRLNLLKFLWYRRRINACRLWALGLKAKYRRQGLDALLYYETFRGARKLGYKWAELSWILEDNAGIIRPIQRWDVRLYKKYRVFELALEPAAGRQQTEP